MTKTTLMEFPCNFPIKVIGIHSQSFLDDVRRITKENFPNFNEGDLTQKKSKQSNYIALTVTVYAENQEMLDAFYQKLTKLPDVKMVL